MDQFTAVKAFSHVKPDDTQYKGGGLRDFFLYRDLGIAGATGGQVTCHLVKANPNCPPEDGTGWHCHECEFLDGGASWIQGDFLDPINRHAWRRWKYDWITPARPGRYTLLARAMGADQRAQPDNHNPNFGSYVIDHPLPIEIFVAAP